MKIILNDDVIGLGEMGEVVETKGGYARNFLIPNNLAMAATKANLNQLASIEKKKTIKRHEQKEEALSIREKVENFSCSITVKVGENGKLFGSVTSIQIAEQLQEAGFDIDDKAVNV